MIRLPKKLVLIGIDGLDPHLLSQLHDVLPNFTALEANGLSLPLRSVFPPDVSTKIEPELNTLHVVSCMESSALRCLPDYASH
jgi:predicted AlkP superfamily phosphohydrolase/phosphomutase